MVKDKEQPKKQSFKEFLKKRAPIYLGLIGLFVIFVVPELTQSNLEKFYPENLPQNEEQAFRTVMSYNGPNQKGLTVIDALKQQIDDDYSDEKIYDKKDTKISFSVMPSEGENNFDVTLTFDTYKESREFVWNVNLESNEITAESLDAKHILDIVNYYD
ncbi:MAG: hypothetical protein DWQ18_08705 [Crenarchaeota archaeon]|nr:MAG: hypothetical protein DWQ17_01080 [Thermoproteota archaeon]RDJ33217.1 MAG: hypothetical protein DWQ18_08705 [Thermoproteota archaeon]RDJ36280.1 MAG: hypothetical protein DWQ19_06615 [Thermoproteota archaeon]RDJ38909.1 MAG: hypothetical protein DWQ13_01080 [Thermoproteota archaeon]